MIACLYSTIVSDAISEELLSVFVTPFETLFPARRYFFDFWRFFDRVPTSYGFTLCSFWFLDERILWQLEVLFFVCFLLDLCENKIESYVILTLY